MVCIPLALEYPEGEGSDPTMLGAHETPSFPLVSSFMTLICYHAFWRLAIYTQLL